MVGARAEVRFGRNPRIATSSQQRHLYTTRFCDTGSGQETLQQVPQGQPAVELPGEDLLAQYCSHVRTDGTQPFADVDHHTALETKPLTDAQRQAGASRRMASSMSIAQSRP